MFIKRIIPTTRLIQTKCLFSIENTRMLSYDKYENLQWRLQQLETNLMESKCQIQSLEYRLEQNELRLLQQQQQNHKHDSETLTLTALIL
jgi:hypothetical protein